MEYFSSWKSEPALDKSLCRCMLPAMKTWTNLIDVNSRWGRTLMYGLNWTVTKVILNMILCTASQKLDFKVGKTLPYLHTVVWHFAADLNDAQHKSWSPKDCALHRQVWLILGYLPSYLQQLLWPTWFVLKMVNNNCAWSYNNSKMLWLQLGTLFVFRFWLYCSACHHNCKPMWSSL